MDHYMLALLGAAVSGVLMAFQGSLNAAQGKILGVWETTFVVHVVGGLLLVVLLFVLRWGQGDLSAWRTVPWYTYGSGAVSVAIIYLVAASIPVAGTANATTAIIIGQVLSAIAIDHYGLFGLAVQPWQTADVAGLLLLAGGSYLLLK